MIILSSELVGDLKLEMEKKNQTFFHRVGNQEKLKAPLIAEWIIHGDLFKPWDMLSCKRNKLQLHALE